jgi:hypothetical protein
MLRDILMSKGLLYIEISAKDGKENNYVKGSIDEISEYTKEVSIDFLEWVSKEGYWRLSESAGHKWFKLGAGIYMTLTTAELYDLFINTQK